MVSLNTTVARSRVFYPRPIPAIPDIVMVDLPPQFRDPQSAYGRYHPILVETIEEHDELEAYFAEERKVQSRPELLDARPSALAADHITVAHYGPPSDDWPYVLLCRWPPALAAATPKDLRMFVRGVYTIELFSTQEALERASDTLLELMKRRRQTRVEIILPEWSAKPGKPPH
jgi:hypothetical protein